MLALTLHEPWVWAFTDADKRIENRDNRPEDWGVRLKRGDYIALHAGTQKSYDLDAAIHLGFMLADDGLVVPEAAELEQGVGAVARFWGVVETLRPESSQARWRAESAAYAWMFDEIWKLPNRVPCRGYQRLWNLPVDVLEHVTELWGKCEAPCPNPSTR